MIKRFGAGRRLLKPGLIIALLIVLAGFTAAGGWSYIWSMVAKGLIDFMNLIAKVFIFVLKLQVNWTLMLFGLFMTSDFLQPKTAIVEAATRAVMIIIIPVLEVALILTAVKIVFTASNPGQRFMAKSQFTKLMLALILIPVSIDIAQLLIDLATAMTQVLLSDEMLTSLGMNGKLDELVSTLAFTAPIAYVPLYMFLSMMSFFAVVLLLIRYLMVLMLVTFLPLSLFLYLFEQTKSVGRVFMKWTVGWIFTPVIISVWTLLAIAMYAGVKDGMDPFIGFWFILAFEIMIVASPLVVVGVMDFLGNMTEAVGQMLPSFAGVAFVAAGGLMKGKGPETLMMAGMKQMVNTGGFDVQKFQNKVKAGSGGKGGLGGDAANAAGTAADAGAQGVSAGMNAGAEGVGATTSAMGEGMQAAAAGLDATVVGAVVGVGLHAGGAAVQGTGMAAKVGMKVGAKMIKVGGKLAKMGGKMVGKGMKMGGKMGGAMVRVGKGIGKAGKAMKRAAPGVVKAGRSLSKAGGQIKATAGKVKPGLVKAAKQAKTVGGEMTTKQLETAAEGVMGGREDFEAGEKLKSTLGNIGKTKSGGTSGGGTGGGGPSMASKIGKTALGIGTTMGLGAAAGALAVPLGVSGMLAFGAVVGTRLATTGLGKSIIKGGVHAGKWTGKQGLKAAAKVGDTKAGRGARWMGGKGMAGVRWTGGKALGGALMVGGVGAGLAIAGADMVASSKAGQFVGGIATGKTRTAIAKSAKTGASLFAKGFANEGFAKSLQGGGRISKAGQGAAYLAGKTAKGGANLGAGAGRLAARGARATPGLAGKGALASGKLAAKGLKMALVGAPKFALETAASGGMNLPVRAVKALGKVPQGLRHGKSLAQYAKYRGGGHSPELAKAAKAKKSADKLYTKAGNARAAGKEGKAQKYEKKAKALTDAAKVSSAGEGGFTEGTVGEKMYAEREGKLSGSGEHAKKGAVGDVEAGKTGGGGEQGQSQKMRNEEYYHSMKNEIMYSGRKKRQQGVGEAFEDMMEDKPEQQ